MGGEKPEPASLRLASSDAWLGAVVLLVFGFAFVPIPPWLLDALLVSSLALATLTLLAALWAKETKQLHAFPVLLLLCTAYRLAINIASTRLILADGYAGQVIDAFAGLVIADDLAVGAAIFSVITLAQFLVVTRGAERTAEVAARFSLDAMPAQQLAIDAERRSGSIASHEAQAQSYALQREAQFYGSMDGSMRFVKGDAIVGILITLLNLFAGCALGITRNAMPWQESLFLFGKLSIGDGLASQVPALLISTAAALVVTRPRDAENPTSLSASLMTTVVGSAAPLACVGVLLLVLGSIPGLPFVPFAATGFATLVAALWLWWRAGATDESDARDSDSTRSLIIYLPPSGMLRMRFDPRERRRVHDTWRLLSDALHEDLGFRLPPPRWKKDTSLEPHTLSCSIQGLSHHVVQRRRPSSALQAISPALRVALREHAEHFLSVRETERLLMRFAVLQPGLAKEISRSVPSTLRITRILRGLLREQVAITPLAVILEALLRPDGQEVSLLQQISDARVALGPYLLRPYLSSDGSMPYLRLDPLVESELLRLCRREGPEPSLDLNPNFRRDLLESVRWAREQYGVSPILVPAQIRSELARLLTPEVEPVAVLSWDEVPARASMVFLAEVPLSRPEA